MKQKDLFDELFFVYSKKLRQRFKSGELPRTWRRKYPQLFSKQDFDLTRKGSSYIFFEWLAVILLFEATGYISYHKWDCKNHCVSNAIFNRLASPAAAKIILRTSGCPDLLAVSPDESDWFLCEIKGPSDKLSAQQKHVARKFLKATGRKVMLLNLASID